VAGLASAGRRGLVALRMGGAAGLGRTVGLDASPGLVLVDGWGRGGG